MANYIPIGDPINRFEEETLRRLRDTLPEHFVVIGNFELQIPNRGNPFEFDAVILAEHGLFCVEIKGWRGEINGAARRWSLDWGGVENPFTILETKTKALRGYLTKTLGSAVDWDSVIFRATLIIPDEATLVFDDPRQKQVTKLSNVSDHFALESLALKMGPGVFSSPEMRQLVLDSMVPALSPSREPGVVSDYEIEAELEGDRTMYREFVGRHKLLRSRSRVRIKLFTLDPLYTPRERQDAFLSVLRDMEALTELESNPYVARGYDVIRDRDDELRFYLVSEWIGRETLKTLLENEGSPRRADAIKYGSHLLKAVHFMHERGIVHRNLHPGVVYLSNDERVPLKITDFEYARIKALPSIASSFQNIGTAGYVAPELQLGGYHDHRVDCYSVGAILFELFTGTPLFNSMEDLMDPEGIWAEARQHLSDDLRDILDVLLHPDPIHRASELQTLSTRLSGLPESTRA